MAYEILDETTKIDKNQTPSKEKVLDAQKNQLLPLGYGNYSESLSKLTLSHDHGVGRPCNNCQGCRGLELHFWRKTCKNCGCKSEEHDIDVNRSIHEKIVYNLLHMTEDLSVAAIELDSDNEDYEQLEKHPLLKDFVKKKESLNNNKSPIVAIDEDMGEQVEVKKESSNDESTEGKTQHEKQQASEKRKNAQLLMRQIPAQDFDPQYCHDLDEFEKNELKCFRFLVQENAIGKGITKLNNFEHDITCVQCSNPIGPHDPYKFVERLPRQQWHADCFKCNKCKDQLAASIYFVHENNIFCGRHYGEKLKNRCTACDELIFSEKYTNAEERNWHTKHFCCYKCDASLANKYYVVIDEQTICVNCYHENVADRCKSCTKPIEAGTKRVNFESFNWHVDPKCFSCIECKKSLIDAPFIPFGDNMFCSEFCLDGYT